MKLPDHLFVAGDGALYDTRKPEWSGNPLRMNYKGTRQNINTTADLRATLRAGRHTSIGGYPMFFITADGAALSFEAVEENYRQVSHSVRHGLNDGWQVVHTAINWEDKELFCDHTNERIPAAYEENEGEWYE